MRVLFQHDVGINLTQVIGRLPGLPGHGSPHFEFLDGLVQGHVHHEFLGMLEIELAAANG